MAHEGEAHPSRTWDPIAHSLKTAIDSLFGKNYRNRRGETTLHPSLRWLSATFGASLSLIAVYMRSTAALLSIEPSQSQLASDMFGRLATILPWIPLVAVVLGVLVGMVVAPSIRDGGPVRLFIAGAVVSALPFALAVARTFEEG